MEKIKFNKYGDYVNLTLEQVQGLFGCISEEYKAKEKGLEICICPVDGADRGFYNLEIHTGDSSYETTATLGDDTIERWIEKYQPEEHEENHDSGLTIDKEYERDHPSGYFNWSSQG